MIRPRLYVSDNFTPFTDLIARYGTPNSRIKKDTVLHDANGPNRTSYYIRKGVAKLSYIDEEGTEGTLFLFGRGSIYPINLLEDMLTMENYPQLVSVTDLDVIQFPALRIREMCAASKEFNFAIINHYVRYVNILLTKLLLNHRGEPLRMHHGPPASSKRSSCRFLRRRCWRSPSPCRTTYGQW